MLKNITNEFSEYSLYINNWDLSSFFEFYPTYIFSLFAEEDKKIQEEKTFVYITYSCSIGSFKKRMEILGIKIQQVKEYLKAEIGYDFIHIIDSFKFLIEKEIGCKDDLSKLIDEMDEDDDKFKFLDAINDDKYGIYGRQGVHIDLRVLLRSALEAFSDNDEISLFISLDKEELEYDSYLPDEIVNDYNVVSYYQDNLIAKSVNEGKIIILTEGSSDIEFLQKSLNLLYPDLTYLFSFFDFHKTKASGSTSFLTHYIRSFISAGIVNKIIAILDNDTAGKESYNLIADIPNIPANYKIFTLPDIDIANSYPTIGPQSENFEMNINGKAVSIELFSGKDTLINDDGNYFPVLWTGYNDKLKQYQGEISAKCKIQDNFRKKIDQIEKGSKKIEDFDWTEMKLLLNKIFTAFDD